MWLTVHDETARQMRSYCTFLAPVGAEELSTPTLNPETLVFYLVSSAARANVTDSLNLEDSPRFTASFFVMLDSPSAGNNFTALQYCTVLMATGH